MKTSTFDIMTRRGSLLTLGGAALTAMATPEVASAGKSGKNAKKRCKKQRGQCFTAVAEFCESTANPSSCEGFYRPCCEHFARCSVGTGIVCILVGD
ncbi:MAG: hypothetical protein ACRDJC_07815 [Thermomicrobiales bacterium]